MMSILNNSREYQLKKKINLWIVIALSAILSNVLLVMLVWYTSVHQKVEITPFSGGQAYIKSDSSIDAHYLEQMSENFINTRLNVTPSNIKNNHARLLNYVDSKYYHNLSEYLLREEKKVIDKKISSYFDVESIKVNPEKLSVYVKGQLRRFVGVREIPSEMMAYQLKFNYHLGRLSIIQFEKAKENNDE